MVGVAWDGVLGEPGNEHCDYSIQAVGLWGCRSMGLQTLVRSFSSVHLRIALLLSSYFFNRTPQLLVLLIALMRLLFKQGFTHDLLL